MSKNSKLIIGCLFMLQTAAFAQKNADPATYAARITAADLKTHLYVLASDSLEGRETGTAGNLKAAHYIADYFKKIGLPKSVGDSSFFQKMVYTNLSWNSIAMRVNGNYKRHQFDYFALPAAHPAKTPDKEETIEANEVLFLGYGIDDEKYSDYKKTDVKGKIILIYTGEPVKGDSVSVITGRKQLSNWSVDLPRKLRVAYQKGAKMVLILDPTILKSVQQNRNQFSRNFAGDVEKIEGVYPPHAYISSDVVKEIIGNNSAKFAKTRISCEKGKAKSLSLKCTFSYAFNKHFTQLIGNNVVAFIEGSDPKLKNEYIIVSAHYDHLGKRGKETFYGADDNASGTSTVLEIAEAFAEAKKQGKGTRRSIICMLVTGEEKGLLGSAYYVKYPIFPLENTVADVNIDMVGRVDEKYADNPNYIYVIGADKLSQDLHNINENMNKQYTNLVLDYTYNAEDDPNRYYYRSDHYNFAQRGIPAIFYFNGTHDDYHRITDTKDKINFDKMAIIGRLAFHTAWEIANRDERLKITAKK